MCTQVTKNLVRRCRHWRSRTGLGSRSAFLTRSRGEVDAAGPGVVQLPGFGSSKWSRHIRELWASSRMGGHLGGERMLSYSLDFASITSQPTLPPVPVLIFKSRMSPKALPIYFFRKALLFSHQNLNSYWVQQLTSSQGCVIQLRVIR